MRPLGILLLAALLALPVAGDVIHLKNGRKIVADRVQVVGNKVEYFLGDNSFAIPKSIVAEIESAGGQPLPPSSGKAPIALPGEPAATVSGLRIPARLLTNGKLNPDALAEVERSGDDEARAAAYFLASRAAHDSGDLDKALRYIERAVAAKPDQGGLVAQQSYLLLRLSRYREAVSAGERAVRLDPKSADAYRYLGFSYYSADQVEKAAEAWRKSLKLRSDRDLEARLAKAERELAAEEGYGQQESRYFTLRYEGRQTAPKLRVQLLSTLDAHYEDLVRELGFAPRENIVVVLYTEEAYFDVTQAPRWSGALYDGKLRIPVGGLDAVTSSLSRSLKHELVHSFIHQMTRGRCPTWLNEGMAMALEPRNSASYAERLASLFISQNHIPLHYLESSFIDLSGPQAQVAYAESLAAVEYIRDTYGMSDLVRILGRIGEGASGEAALRATIHSGYKELEQEMTADYKKRFGN